MTLEQLPPALRTQLEEQAKEAGIPVADLFAMAAKAIDEQAKAAGVTPEELVARLAEEAAADEANQKALDEFYEAHPEAKGKWTDPIV